MKKIIPRNRIGGGRQRRPLVFIKTINGVDFTIKGFVSKQRVCGRNTSLFFESIDYEVISV